LFQKKEGEDSQIFCLSSFSRFAVDNCTVSGVLRALRGANLLNLNRVTKLIAYMASIGGAGTFDGVFLSGISAVIIFVL
jgi:uncharacterized membrane protein